MMKSSALFKGLSAHLARPVIGVVTLLLCLGSLGLATPRLHAAPPPAPSRQVPRAFLMEGLWSDVVKVRPATHIAGMLYDIGNQYTSPYRGPRSGVDGLPAPTAAAYSRYAVVVVSNVDAVSLNPQHQAALVEYVRNGGGLVILGGYWSFARGGYSGSKLSELFPVTLPPEGRINAYYEGLPLQAAPTADWKFAMDFSVLPRAYFVQNLPPKPEATVQVMAGDQPAIVSMAFGKGRVVTSALTANGEARKGDLAYWDWPGWPDLLAQCMTWAASSPDAPRASTANDTATAATDAPAEAPPLDTLLTAQLDPQALTPAVLDLAIRTVNEESADLLFSLMTQELTAGKCPVNRVAPALIPFAKPEWAKDLLPYAGALNADRPGRQAAMRLLAATRSPNALGLMRDGLEDPDVANSAIDGLGLLGDPSVIPQIRRLYNRSRAACTSPLDPKDMSPDVFAHEQSETLVACALALYRLGDPDGVTRLQSTFRDVNFYFRIFRNAAKRRARDPVGIETARRLQVGASILGTLRYKLISASAPIPDSQVAAFVKAAGATTDMEEVRFFGEVLNRSAAKLPPGALAPLATAPDGIMRRFGTAPNAAAARP